MAAAGDQGVPPPVVVDEAGQIVLSRMFDFLDTYYPDPDTGVPLYASMLYDMQQEENAMLAVNMSHLLDADAELAEAIMDEFYRYEPNLRKAVQELVRKHLPEYVREERGDREFFIGIFNLPETRRLRDLRTEHVGRLVSIAGTVTRTSEVRPELLFGTFKCLGCGSVVENVEQQFKYTEPLVCKNPVCGEGGGAGGDGGGGDGGSKGRGGGGGGGQWQLEREMSKFVDWQRLRVQENPDEIPAGCMPSSMDVIVRHDMVEKAKAGDKMVFTGTLIVLPDVSQLARVGETPIAMKGRGGAGAGGGEGVRGLKQLGCRDLTYKLAFLATAVANVVTARGVGANIRDESGSQEIIDNMDPDERDELVRMEADPQLYQNLVKSVCPSVFGHYEIKRGVLLMLTGGVHKQTAEGINLRGDINVCIVGDPSTAKSQFLKYVHEFLPRAVYTSGKASSAAGLTASVAKDPDTGEFCIEAGALMLADNGICCIDEFEKMEQTDQVAIHEAMEQQTISITKAGIQATLNARTSILAAANPLHGRYDLSKPLASNVIIPPPIMSRFDLFFVVVDKVEQDQDRSVASHILAMHRANMSNGAEVIAEPPKYSKAQLQRYIRFARTHDPWITPKSRRVLVNCYRELRAGDAAAHGGRTAYRITVRQLESMVRLSEALARLHLKDTVEPKFVMEAFRLLKASIVNVESDGIELGAMGEFGGDDDDDDDDDDDLGEDGGDDGPPPGAFDEEDDPYADAGIEGDEPVEAAVAGDAGVPAAAAEAAPAAAPAEAEAAAAPKKAKVKLQISYEKFQRIQQSVVLHLRSNESEEALSMRQGDVVAWYLGEQHDIAGAQELAAERTLVNRVIGRLVSKRENSLVYVDPDAKKQPEEERLIAVHPNYEG